MRSLCRAANLKIDSLRFCVALLAAGALFAVTGIGCTSSSELQQSQDDLGHDGNNADHRDDDSDGESDAGAPDDESAEKVGVPAISDTGDATISLDAGDVATSGHPLEISLADLAEEFLTDVDSAKEKYKGRFVQVSGVTGGNISGNVLYLKTAQDGKVAAACFYYDSPKEQQDKLANVPGLAKASIVGRIDLYLNNRIELGACRLVEIQD